MCSSRYRSLQDTTSSHPIHIVPGVVARAAWLLVLLLTAAPAQAQWFGAVYLGGNYTQTADVTVDQPSRDTSLTFHDVSFAAEPLASPQYYGGRFGRMFGSARRVGVEIEFIHLKVIGKTANTVHVSGRYEGEPVDHVVPMDTFVQRYLMTHGLNFLLANLVVRTPMRSGGRVAIVGRAGVGPTLPHAESAIAHVSRAQYEYAGMGTHAAAGLDVQLRRRLSAMIEYKFTAACPTIGVTEGHGRTTALSHHLAIGLAFGVSR